MAIASLVLSIAALGVAISARSASTAAKPDAALVHTIVDAELQRRESEMVGALAPKFRLIYRDMLGPDEKLDERTLNPKTLADLARPLFTIIQKMQGTADPANK
jgi:hypothetical protein